MPRHVACAVVRDDPPQVFVADDLETLNWVLALKLVSRIPSREMPESGLEPLRAALVEERWGDAVALWMRIRPGEVDVYPSYDYFTADDVDFAAQELQFSPLFAD